MHTCKCHVRFVCLKELQRAWKHRTQSWAWQGTTKEYSWEKMACIQWWCSDNYSLCFEASDKQAEAYRWLEFRAGIFLEQEYTTKGALPLLHGHDVQNVCGLVKRSENKYTTWFIGCTNDAQDKLISHAGYFFPIHTCHLEKHVHQWETQK